MQKVKSMTIAMAHPWGETKKAQLIPCKKLIQAN